MEGRRQAFGQRRGHQHEAVQAVAVRRRQPLPHATGHGEADEGEGLDAQRVGQRHHVLCVLRRGVGRGLGRLAPRTVRVAAGIEQDAAVARRQQMGLAEPRRVGTPPTVVEDYDVR